jgi:hypothetical protein
MEQPPVRLDDLISHVLAQHPDGGALQHLSDAVTTSSHLGDVADHLIGHFVDQARRSGATWTEIGQHMGVSKQAAQQRFVPRGSTDVDPPKGLFRRFTQRARHVVELARTEAQERGASEVTNEHVVLGLLGEPEGLAAQAITAVGVELEQVRFAVEVALGAPGKRAKSVRFGRGPKKTMELALREALHMGHNYIGTEHLLLGLLRNDKERAAKLLIDLGITHERAGEWIADTLAGMV